MGAQNIERARWGRSYLLLASLILRLSVEFEAKLKYQRALNAVLVRGRELIRCFEVRQKHRDCRVGMKSPGSWSGRERINALVQTSLGGKRCPRAAI